MRCAEAQELLSEGKSTLFFNAPHRDSLHPFTDEVDGHVEDCPECGEVLIRLLRHQLWRRPGPRHGFQVYRAVRRERASIAFYAEQIKIEEAPLIRVANVILMEAIKNEASGISFEPVVVQAIAQESMSQSLSDVGVDLDRITSDMDGANNSGCNDDLAWSVEYAPVGRVTRKIVLPDLVMCRLLARYKSMADLQLLVTDRPQVRTIPIRCENRDYTVTVQTNPEPIGERLFLEVIPA